MLSFISQNLATIIIAGALGLILGLIVRKMIKDHKAGETCSCGCAECPSSGICRNDR